MTRSVFVWHLPFEPSGGVVGKAQLASGSWIESEVEHLNPELLSEVEERNARGRLGAPSGD